MISIQGPWNKVGLGNHLFIYSYLRLISEQTNYQLVCEPMLFSERNDIHIAEQYSFPNISIGLDYRNSKQHIIDDGFSHEHKDVDGAIAFFKNNKFHIISNGYYQKYSYWKKYKSTVKSYFKDFVSDKIHDNNDIAIHLRKSLQDPKISLSHDYYLQALQRYDKINQIFIYADNINRHIDVLQALAKYKPTIMNLNVKDSIRDITSFNNIICSQGSFSFWSAFLSNAEHIVWPITQHGPNKILDNWSIDYVVDDEPRYKFIETL